MTISRDDDHPSTSDVVRPIRPAPAPVDNGWGTNNAGYSPDIFYTDAGKSTERHFTRLSLSDDMHGQITAMFWSGKLAAHYRVPGDFWRDAAHHRLVHLNTTILHDPDIARFLQLQQARNRLENIRLANIVERDYVDNAKQALKDASGNPVLSRQLCIEFRGTLNTGALTPASFDDLNTELVKHESRLEWEE